MTAATTPTIRTEPTPSRLQAMLPSARRPFLDKAVEAGVLDADDRDRFLADRIDRLREYSTDERLGHALVQAEMLTSYQLDRLLSGNTHGLVLGNYRVREELGRGGMGTVYLGEHRLMKRRVALKVLPVDDDCHPSIKARFYGEMRVLAELSHPNIVQAFDAGEIKGGKGQAMLIYLAMELLELGDLEKTVVRRGVCGIAQACGYIRQAAAGLQAAHDRHVVHRDLKPSNLLLGAGGVVKVVDFGLARQFSSRLTDQRALLGSVEFMPPEQSHDPSGVGKEADIYGLGATLFWLITGEGPYPYQPHIGHALRTLQHEKPRRLRDLRGDVPPELDDVVARMLERNPADRPATALAVSNALRPFAVEAPLLATPGKPVSFARNNLGELGPIHKVMVVDDELRIRLLNRMLMEQIGCDVVEARDGRAALELADRHTFDLVLLDIQLPDIDGFEVCRRLREGAENPHLKILIISGAGDADELSEALPRGADDYIVKPYEQKQLLAKASHALELKTVQDRERQLAYQLYQVNLQLEDSLRSRNADLREAHNALLFTIAKLAESRDGETPGHIKRMQLYTQILAREVGKSGPWQGLVDDRFLEMLDRCVPLHDIGKIGLPDDILLKPASLSPSERQMVEEHPVIGDKMLEALADEYGASLDFLGTARVIVRHHHERYDGKGYPDKLVGDAIPPAARLVAVADVYDALRRMRLYKPAMSHAAAIKLMTERSPGQFDPALVAALTRCQADFERVYDEVEE